MRQLPRRPHQRGHRRLRAPDARALACGSTRPTRTRSRRTGTSSASRRATRRATPTTSASSASTATSTRPPTTGRSRPASATCTPTSPRSARRRPTASPRSRARWPPRRATATPPARAGGSARRTRAHEVADARPAPAPRDAPRAGGTRRAPAAHRASASAPCSARGALAAARRGRRRRRSPGRSRSPADPGRGRVAAAALARARSDAALLPAAAPLDRIARAVCDAYVALGELRPEAAGLARRSSRARPATCAAALRDATPEEAERVTAALDALLGAGRAAALPALAAHRAARPAPGGRCCASRPGAGRPLTVVARGARRPRPPQGARGGARGRLAPLARPRELRFTQRDGPGREALADAAAQEWSYDTQRRDVWQ